MKTKFSICSMPNRILSYSKIYRKASAEANENEVFDLSYAEPYLIPKRGNRSKLTPAIM